MRPLLVTRHKVLWAIALPAFAAAVAAGFRSGNPAEVTSGVVITTLVALLSLKKNYKSPVGALGALITLGLLAGCFLAALALATFLTHGWAGDALLISVTGIAAVVILVPALAEVFDVRKAIAELKSQGKTRRLNPIFLAAATVFIIAGSALLWQGYYFPGIWLLALGVMRGALEVTV